MDVVHDGRSGAGQNVSALMDGELEFERVEREIARLKAEPAARDCWNTYHLIGDAIRGSNAGIDGFASRFGERLALEPTVLAPRMRVTRRFQTYALSAAASVAAVGVVGWAAFNVLAPSASVGELAQGVAPSAVATPAAALPASAPFATASPAPVSEAVPAQVQEYLLAHQGISPSTAIQGVTPYIRTVSNTGE